MTDMRIHASSNATSEAEFGYGQLFGVLLRRWIWIAGAVGLGLAGGLYMGMQQKPSYMSSMQLLVEPNFENELTESDLTGLSDSRVSETDYATQLNLMRSDQFIQEAVDKLQTEYPDITLETAIQSFSLNRVVEESSKLPVPTRIFEAQYIDNDPVKSQKFLETIQQVYLDYNQKQQSDRLIRGLQHVNERLTNTRENLEQAQSNLEQFRQNQNLIDPAVQTQSISESLNQVQKQRQQLTAEYSAAESRYQTLQQQLALSPREATIAARLSQSGRIQQVLSALQQTSLDLADNRVIFTDSDPTVQNLIEQRNNQLAELRQTISSITQEPTYEIDGSMLSRTELGEVDISLVSELVEAEANLKSIEAQQQSLSELESQLRAEINKYPSVIAEYDRLQPNVEIERNTLTQLLEQREQLRAELARNGFNWEVVVSPTMGVPMGAGRLQPLLMGGVVGLFLGGILAFALESVDKVVRTSDELKRQVPLPLLGILPLQSTRRFRPLSLNGQAANPSLTLHPELADSELVQNIISPYFRESLDVIANTLQLLQAKHAPRAIAITSGLPGEGKTTLTLGLALSFARMNKRVLVIDADLRQSGIQAELGLNFQGGLSTYLQGLGGTEKPHRLEIGGKSVDVLPTGATPHDPIALLSSPRFDMLLNKSKQIYDIVLVDTPPVLGMADALKVGAVCDGTVLLTRLDQITHQELTDAVALLSSINLLGMVANGAKDDSARYVLYGSQASASTQTDSH